MSEYREKTTGEIKTQGEWRAVFKNMSLPKVWGINVCNAMNIDPVLASPAATVVSYQISVRNGVEKDSKGNWVEKYVAQNMFADIAGGKTKSQQESEYQATLDATTAANHRSERNSKLAETDWAAMSDLTMTDAMKTYRQALRDLPTHSNWPNLEDADWPTKP
jgi:hypothetical protein